MFLMCLSLSVKLSLYRPEKDHVKNEPIEVGNERHGASSGEV